MADGPPRIAYGGKALYGARVGILMLETRFRASRAIWGMR
jgi:hypothetical protein